MPIPTSFSSSSRIALPISVVPTLRMLGCMMSAGAQAAAQRPGDGLVDQVGLLGQAVGIAQRHAVAGDGGDGVGEALAGDVGGRAVHRLVERLALAGLGVGRTERGRGQHADGARQHRRLVGEHVAEQVVAHDHVELLGVAHQLHGAGIGQDVLQLDVLELLGVHRGDHLVPQHAGAHDVALLGRVHLVVALAGEVEGDAGDALDLARRVDGGIDGALLAVLQRHDLLGLAEVGAAGQLAQDEDVEALHHLAPQRGGLGQRGIADGGAQVGEQVEVLAQPQQAGLGPDLVGHLVPLRPAHGAEQDGIGGVGLGQRLARRAARRTCRWRRRRRGRSRS